MERSTPDPARSSTAATRPDTPARSVNSAGTAPPQRSAL